MMKKERQYSWCRECGQIVCRIPNHRHGDGQVDTDEHPVWLLSDIEELSEEGLCVVDLPLVYCGCND